MLNDLFLMEGIDYGREHPLQKSPNAEGGMRRACPPREGRVSPKGSIDPVGERECRGDREW